MKCRKRGCHNTAYYDGLCTLAARLARLIEREPDVLRRKAK